MEHPCDPTAVAVRFIALERWLCCAICGVTLAPAHPVEGVDDVAFA